MGAELKTNNEVADQRIVDLHFRECAIFWDAAYRDRDLRSLIFQDRRDFVLSQVHRLRLPRDASVLDAGCGAGPLAVSLAETYLVTAVDTVPEMLQAARQRASAAGLDARLVLKQEDAHKLSFGSETFDLVVSIGVLPWFSDISKPLQELARVLRPGGYMIVSIDNTWALNRLIDPRMNPALEPLKRWTRRCLSRLGLIADRARVHFSSKTALDRGIADAGCTKLSGTSLGFGPFTLFDTKIMAESTGIALHRRLQQAAEKGWPLLRFSGSNYIVVAQKTAPMKKI